MQILPTTTLKVGILFLLLTWLMGVPEAVAQKRGALEIDPAIIEVTLDKNAFEVQIPLTFTNHSDQFLSLEVYPIDFKQQDGNGAISFLGQESGSYSYSLSSFLQFATRTVELGPRQKDTVNVLIRDRVDLSPGGHYAAVIAKILPNQENTNGAAQVAPSVSSLILLRKVGGERFNLSLKDIDFPEGSVSFRYPKNMTMLFQNEGNIHLVPYGVIVVKDLFGRVVSEGSINTSSVRVFPSSRRYISADMNTLKFSLPFSLNTIEVQGQDSLKKTTFVYQETYVYINPWFVPGIIALIIGIWIYKRKRKKRVLQGSSIGTIGLVRQKTLRGVDKKEEEKKENARIKRKRKA